MNDSLILSQKCKFIILKFKTRFYKFYRCYKSVKNVNTKELNAELIQQ